MSCFFNQRCCQRNQNQCYCSQYYYRQFDDFNQGRRGPAGPIGPRGPQGFTGATGAPGLNGTIYAGAPAATAVAAGAIVPIATISNSANSPFTITANAINVPTGTYLVTFGMDANTGATASIAESTLYVNGVALPTEYVTEFSSTTEPFVSSKTILLSFATAGTLALYNTSATTATYDTGYITITQLTA